MLVLLPPSETKRDGGDEGSSLDLAALSFPQLTAARKPVLSAVKSLSRNLSEASAALGLSAAQRFEIDRNRAISKSPTMPVMDRFTGVLYDGLAATELEDAPREWLANHVVVHSALFGLLRAGDRIPAYRLSHDSRLAGLPLKRHWSSSIAAALEAHDGLILDLRSESYASLGPAPVRENSVYLRVVTEGPDGTKRALNHFNKKGKGEFVRALALSGLFHEDVPSLLSWADTRGIRLAAGAPGELELTV
ncbi:peroxide stress protein YaaA [Glaciihabitans arcticus]|uniref:Peroxide stress protein YaaA n=1 Tax=Glaciihabitans arcticus TaxID=2668039 RepID=A0A4Q9GNE7_9MICO|nr:peroxide stress protein YaaA [Glaciihabitans arcticus]TBN56322.1 peroxide stress protein YaaA [Glaciihabitans arcticus]